MELPARAWSWTETRGVGPKRVELDQNAWSWLRTRGVEVNRVELGGVFCQFLYVTSWRRLTDTHSRIPGGFQAFSRCTGPHCSRALCGHPEASSDAELRGSVGTRRPPQKVRRSVETRSRTSCCPPSKRHRPIESAMQFAARRGSRCVESSMILLCERGELARSAEYPRDRSRTRQILSERLRRISPAEPP